ncbi:hypothetical protein [Desulfosporosinus sp. BG]|uniref:hypothetical protein n=1 Tax=Desulfosporosinus sp. BG TaxID=1633135 RepID=UPI00083A9C60|nr:hypothetical protein [Desulfosporosinus sp. BG]ODA40206.1 hypothetical protein DSBG_2977 [Desulfosporosinus sp. BG]
MARSPIKHLIAKEGIASIFFLVFCQALALKFAAGIGTSNQAPSVEHAVAPWIFGPFQILLLYLPPWLGALLFPLIVIAGLAGLPWIADYWGVKSGQRIFMILGGTVILLLIWFMMKEFWWI